jgi:nucleoside-diphosphate-sugar epimerase
MKITLTGANRPLGRLALEHLSKQHTVVPICCAPETVGGQSPCRTVDLCDEQQVEPIVNGADAIVHLAEFDPRSGSTAIDEKTLLERASFGAYRLCWAAREAGAARMVIVGSLAVFDSYPADYLIDELWQPRPSSEPNCLAPYVPELVAREFAREGGIGIVCLRFGRIGDDPEGTPVEDALEAIDRSLAYPFTDRGYRWRVFHISSSPRFIMRNAHRELGFARGKEA